MVRVLMMIAAVLVLATGVRADAVRTSESPGLGGYNEPFWPDVNYDDNIKSPSDYLGFELGSRPTTYEEIISYFTYLANALPNVELHPYAKTYEGRDLVYLVIASEENASRLDAIRKDHDKLADPRKLDGDAEKLAKATPAVAWLAYGIHGDEVSSGDASLQLAWQLVAGRDETTALIRREIVVLIDPMENPDGRSRWLTQLAQWNGVVPNSDIQSFQHRGLWPYGRGNHYLFDLNRDWFTEVHPESKGRIRAILEWHPQFILDCHEMGPTDTYLFSPPRPPFNPFMVSQIYKWWDALAKDQAAAFDRYGWSYYTREWNEEFFPGYGSSWGIYGGAIGTLYEQAGVDGSLVKRPDGTIMTYRETVHHQFISSMANLMTVAKGHDELMADYVREKEKFLRSKGGAFLFPPTSNYSRLQQFAETLDRQDIEVEIASKPFKVSGARSSLGGNAPNVEMPEGTMIVRLTQPMHALIQTILTFDIRMGTKFLVEQKKEVLKNNDSRIYDTTGWSMALGYNIESYFVDKAPSVETVPYAPSALVGRVENEKPKFGWAVSNADDNSQIVLAHLLEHGHKVWAAHKPFQIDGRRFERGSFVIKRTANPDLDEDELKELALANGVTIYGINTALGGALADLGGDELRLLERPRIGIVGGSGVSTYEFGATWHLLDAHLGIRVSTLDIESLARLDLRKYNVIVMPSTWAGDAYERMLGESGLKALKDWVHDGGTLVAMGSATAFLADSSVALTSVRQRSQVLKDIAEFEDASAWMAAAEAPLVDSLAVWEGKSPRKSDEKTTEKTPPDLKTLEKADELAVRLRPRGVIMAVDLDEEDWLCFGVRSPAPLMVSTRYTYVAKKDVRTAARFADEQNLRLSGLLWPEARVRWSGSVYAAHERRGNGQVIIFAGQPNFRAYFHGGERLLLNALLLGPGFGARQTIEF